MHVKLKRGLKQKRLYDFLLVISSNLGPISRRFWDTASYWLKIANSIFSTLVNNSAFVAEDKKSIGPADCAVARDSPRHL